MKTRIQNELDNNILLTEVREDKKFVSISHDFSCFSQKDVVVTELIKMSNNRVFFIVYKKEDGRPSWYNNREVLWSCEEQKGYNTSNA